MKDRKPHQTAALEALEEAGLVGKASKTPIGSYHYYKRLDNGANVWCEVIVFPLKVAKQRKKWPEQNERKFGWFALDEAAERVAEPELQGLLLTLGAIRLESSELNDMLQISTKAER